MARPKTIAFYLPQFYPIPENDAWYREGFSEWRNVVLARALFPGHYQPRLPGALGFYDLRAMEVREQQAALARAHGIDAFCYYHYWFEGNRPLRRVVDDVLKYGQPDFPFCLAWANENWSRHWDASTHEILLRQTYSPRDDEEHAQFLLHAMSHPLYLRIDGRPLLFIYRIQGMPDPEATLRRWRELWRAGGLGEVQIVKFDTHENFDDPATFGADAAAEFLPHGVVSRVPRLRPKGLSDKHVVLDYADVARHYMGVARPAWTRYECVVPAWDNAARRADRGSLVLHGSTPELYENWLSAVYERAGDETPVLINAWNEWAEGAYLEPDLRHGDAYLKATRRALKVDSDSESSRALTPLASVPAIPRDRFGELYLDLLAAQTTVQRRLSRLEATLDRQLDLVRAEAREEVDEWRSRADALAHEVTRLRAILDNKERDCVSRTPGPYVAAHGRVIRV